MSEEKIKVGISQGDINGLGLEVIIKTFMEPQLCEVCTPVLFSSQKTVGYYRRVLGLEDLNLHPTRDLNQLNNKKPNIFICYEEEVSIEMGKSTSTGGKYALLSLERAAEALLNNDIDVLVTAPINKENIKSEQFNFTGHTEYLAHKIGQGQEAMMFMCSDELKIALVTGHLPLSKVAASINTEKIVKRLQQLHHSLITDFNIRKPRIAVLGLNPHAGDNGVIGNEDKDIIAPAIEQVKNTMLAFGPYPADGFFGNGTYKKFDAVLAMYHDQGLIPFKTLAFNNGVNYTAGLPFIRTSPDHGTAYDIAGKNIGNEESFKKAIYTAIDIYRNRKQLGQLKTNPLSFSYIKKER